MTSPGQGENDDRTVEIPPVLAGTEPGPGFLPGYVTKEQNRTRRRRNRESREYTLAVYGVLTMEALVILILLRVVYIVWFG